MKSENINKMFQRHLDPVDSLFYPDFLNDLCKHIVSVCITHMYVYMKVICPIGNGFHR